MANKREELYQILMSIDEFNATQFNRLALIYGEDEVNEMIKKIILETGDNLGKFANCPMKLYSNLNSGDDYVDAYDCYMNDVKQLDTVGNGEKVELLSELIIMIREMEELFLIAGCDKLIFPNNRKPWICDKVNYSLENCRDISLLNKIKELYNMYLIKRERFMREYLKFVVFIAKQYFREDGLPLADLVQFGNLGLIRALELYNPEFGNMFSTYAGIIIRRSIVVNSKNVMYVIRKPFHIFELNNRRIDAINILVQKLGREPSTREVAEYMGKSVDEIKLVANDFSVLTSLDELHEYCFDEMLVNIVETAADENVNVEEEVFDSCLVSDMDECLFKYLDERERLIIRYIYENNMDYLSIGASLGISKQRVGQIHNKVLERLRKNSRVIGLKSYLK